MGVIEVAIGPEGSAGTFLVHIVRSPAGEASAAVVLDTNTLLARRAELQRAVLASAVTTRRVLDDTERSVREVGEELFRALLGTGDVAGRYRASSALTDERGQGLRVLLRIDDPALAGLPWEAMYDEVLGNYVCRQDQLVRHVPVPSMPAPLAVGSSLSVLAVISSPRGMPALDVDKEKAQLTRALSRLSEEGLAEVQWAVNATWADLQDLLLSGHWHVMHFIWHGDFDAASEEGVLALAGDDGRAQLVHASSLVDLLRQARPMPRLVVLNSCAGAVTGKDDMFSGTAAALVRGGVSAVAAMQYEISDPAAIAFARGFYSAIARGRGVDEAVSSGRVAILGISGRTLEWITPVLYLRGEESHLFTNKEPSSSKSTQATQGSTAEPSAWPGQSATPVRTGLAFISYVREDSGRVDAIQAALETAGIRVWRDTAELWPGQDWRVMIRRAITDNALAFVACFSRNSVRRSKSYQNEELTLATEQLRLRRPDQPWLIPVRLDDCVVPDIEIGDGRTLASIQRADIFGPRAAENTARLVSAVLHILGLRNSADAESWIESKAEEKPTAKAVLSTTLKREAERRHAKSPHGAVELRAIDFCDRFDAQAELAPGSVSVTQVRELAATCIRVLGPGVEVTWRVHYWLARWLAATDQTDSAISTAEQVVAGISQLTGTDDSPLALRSLELIAHLLHRSGRYAQALSILRFLAALLDRSDAADEIAISTRVSLAEILIEIGQLDEASGWAEEIILIGNADNLEEHLDISRGLLHVIDERRRHSATGRRGTI